MALYEATYITYKEVRDNTTNKKLVAEPEALITQLIVKAQIILDGYIGAVDSYADDQDYKFPNTDNLIPKNVKQATIYIVEAIYTELIQSRNWVKSEAWDGYSVSYAENVSSSNFEYVTQAAKNMLNEYGLGEAGLAAFKLNY